MKKSWVLVACLAATLGLAGSVSAQGVAPASTGLKVGVVNVGLVFTKYDKANQMKKQMEDLLNPFKLEAEKLKKEIIEWQKAMEKVTDPMLKAQYENGIRYNKRKLEDIDLEARRKVGKQQEDQLVQLFKEMQTAIELYGKSQGFGIILGYGDPPDAKTFEPALIMRVMNAVDMGGLTKLYIAPNSGLDISQGVVDYLNQQYRQVTGGQSTPPRGN